MDVHYLVIKSLVSVSSRLTIRSPFDMDNNWPAMRFRMGFALDNFANQIVDRVY